MILDSTNNLYISGYYSGTLTINSSNNTYAKTFAVYSGIDIFIAKYDNSGSIIYCGQISSTQSDTPVIMRVV